MEEGGVGGGGGSPSDRAASAAADAPSTPTRYERGESKSRRMAERRRRMIEAIANGDAVRMSREDLERAEKAVAAAAADDDDDEKASASVLLRGVMREMDESSSLRGGGGGEEREREEGEGAMGRIEGRSVPAPLGHGRRGGVLR